jgi:hypothetical protein
MRIILLYTAVELKFLFRNYSTAFFTLLFPAFLLLITGHQGKMGDTSKLGTFVVFCNYAVQCVVFQYLGINIAQEKSSMWTKYLQSLPINRCLGYIGKAIAILLASLLSLLFVIALVAILSDLELSFMQYLWIIFSALIGGIPMVFLAIAIGNIISAGAARSVFVLLNLALLFGAFSIPDHGYWNYLRNITPSFQWLQLGISQLSFYQINKIFPWLWMSGFTVIFFILMWYSEYQKSIKIFK